MIKKHTEAYKSGYNPITFENGTAGMDFGIIALGKNDACSNDEKKERAFLLIEGDAEIEYNGQKQLIRRDSFLDDNPVCLHVPQGIKVSIMARDKSEVAYFAVGNEADFSAEFYTQEDCTTDTFGKGTLGETSVRYVRTVFDDNNAPYSNMVVGEVVNFPGKWSSYPPHHHAQPEIYYYRFYPEQGFGFSCEGEDVTKIYDRDTAVITGGLVHPQVAAPGYAMYYIWTIPHTPKRWKKDRIFIERDAWMLQDDAQIWPDK